MKSFFLKMPCFLGQKGAIYGQMYHFLSRLWTSVSRPFVRVKKNRIYKLKYREYPRGVFFVFGKSAQKSGKIQISSRRFFQFCFFSKSLNFACRSNFKVCMLVLDYFQQILTSSQNPYLQPFLRYRISGKFGKMAVT